MEPIEKNYKYDAFISYRHSNPDGDIAKALHKLLETFSLPKEFKDSGWLGRCFIDREELTTRDLTDSIVEAIGQSRFFICVCSKQTKLSPWCQKEMELFCKTHGEEQVLVLLVEGEPREVFFGPLTRSDTNRESLAADIRPPSLRQGENLEYALLSKKEQEICKAQALKLLKETEIYRIMAGMLGISYGDLRQRGRERRIRLLLRIGSMVLAAALVFALCMWNMYRQALRAELRARQQTALMVFNYAESSLRKGDRILSLLIADKAMELSSDAMEESSYLHALQYSVLNRALIREPYSGISRISMGRESILYTIVEEGKKLLVIGENNTVELWDIATGRKEKSIDSPIPLVSVVADPRGKTIVCNAFDRSLQLWDMESETYTPIGTSGELYYTAMRITKNGRFLVGMMDTSPSVRFDIWDISQRKLIYTKDFEGDNKPEYVVSSEDGEFIAYVLSDASLVEMDLNTLEERQLLPPEEKFIFGKSLLYSQDGRYLYRCLKDTLYIMDRENPGAVEKFQLSRRASGLASYKDHLYLSILDGSGFMLFDLKSKKETGTLIGKKASLSNFEVNPANGDMVAIWSDNSASVWYDIDYSSWENALSKEITDIQDASSVRLSFADGGRYLVHSATDRTILILDTQGNAKHHPFQGSLLAQSRNYRYTLHIDDENLYLYDVQTGEKKGQMERPEDFTPEFHAFALNNTGTLMAVSDLAGANVQLVDIATGNILAVTPPRKTTGEYITLSRIVFSQDDKTIFAAFSDGRVESYRTDTGEMADFSQDLGMDIQSLVLSQEDQWIAVNTVDHTSHLFDISGESLESIPGECYSLYEEKGERKGIGVAEDNIFLYTMGKGIQVIPTNNLRQGGESERLSTNSISPDRHYLLTNVAGGDTVLTDAATGAYIKTYSYQSASQGKAYFTPEGEGVLYDSQKEGAVLEKIYSLEELERLSRQTLGDRHLSDEELEKIGRSQ